ncbi:MAG: HAMP domain-containing histidine kinase [Elusimicrobia bacterium]|nr:HAMP domain-containing histidine kinase [Elusimicrobiota bacterium]
MSLLAAAALGAAAGWASARLAARRRELRLAKLLSFVAHEVNSPLASLKLTSAGFLQDLYGPVSPQHRPWLAMMREQTARCEALVGDLRDFLHLELHRDLSLHLEEVDFKELFEEAAEEMSTAFGRADAPLEASVSGALPALHADPDRLRRVLLAVLAHAKKFRASGPVKVTAAPKDGGVEVALDFVSLPIPEDGRRLMLDLWQPALARDGRGTSCVGLGLGFSARLVELHGGRLTFSMDGANACRIVASLPRRAS